MEKNLPTFLHYFISLNIPLAQLIFEININQQNIDDKTYNEKFMKILYSENLIIEACKREDGLLKTMINHDKLLLSNTEHLSTKELNNILEQLTEGIIEKIYPIEPIINGIASTNRVANEEGISPPLYTPSIKIIRDLFFWAILVNYIDMAKALLAHINHRICAALIARKILSNYEDKYILYDDKKTEYIQSMDYFEDYAIECLKLCYKNNPNKACELILRQCDLFGNVTCLQVSNIHF